MLLAREALASGDDESMWKAVANCQAFERTGCDVIEATKAKSLRRLGGKHRGKDQTEAATECWKPYSDYFDTLRQAGKSIAVARKIVKAQMVKDKFAPPGCDGFPSDRTIREWLK
jgi:hypothetical protein